MPGVSRSKVFPRYACLFFCQAGDINVDSIEENEEDMVIENDEEKESDRAHFRKLEQFLDKEDMYSPISVPVKISTAEL